MSRVRRRGGRSTASAVTAAATALVGAGTFAAWTSTSTSTSGTFTAANVTHTNTDTNGTTFATALGNMLPGDYLYRYRTLVNTGSVTQTMTGAVTPTGTLATTSGGLELTVSSCPVAWVGTVCASPASVLATTGTSTSPAISYGAMAAGATMYLQYKFDLPAAADQTTFQAQTGTVTVAVTGATAAASDRTAG